MLHEMVDFPAQTKKSYRLDIQGLRALAVIAVIANHLDRSIFPNGFLGVDIFFVISGFVITSLLSESKAPSLASFIVQFYERRIKRLFPALILCVLVTTVASLMLIAPWQNVYYGPAWHTGLTALLGLSNMYLLSLSMDYFGGSAELNPFTQTWSLGVEEQFYLIYPVLFWGANRYFSRHQFLAIMALLGLASMLAFIWLSQTNPPAAFYLMPARFWELALGCIAFYFTNKFQALNFASLCFMAIISIILFLDGWPITATFAVTILTAGMLAAPSQNSLVQKVLSSRAAVYIGAISYPLYLWHWSVLSLSRWTVGVELWTAPFQIALMLGLAAATYRWVEVPLKNAAWSPVKLRTIFYGLAALGLALAVVSVMGSTLKGQLYVGTRSDMKIATSVSSEFSSSLAAARNANQKCNLTSDNLRGADYRPRPNANAQFYTSCLTSKSPKVVLTGDSFSEVISPHIAMIAARMGYDYKSVLGYGCPFPLQLAGVFRAETHCNIDIDFMRQQIVANLNRGDILVLRLSLAKQQYVKFNRVAVEQGDQNQLQIYDNSLESLRSNVEAKGAKFLLVGSNLTQEFSPACSNHQWFNTEITKVCDAGISFNSSVENQLSSAFDNHLSGKFGPGNYFSVMSYLCDNKIKICKTNKQGTYLYDDDSHLNAAAVDLVAGDLEQTLRKMIP